MKQFKFLATISVILSMAFLLFSCGSGGDKKGGEPATDTTKIAEKTPEPAPAPVAEPAKPVNVMVIQHKVANYAKWKPLYESHDSVRRAHGLSNYVLGRGLDDSNLVMIVLRMDDVAKAKEFAALPGLKETMKKGGVIGKPTFTYIDAVMSDQSPIDQTTRLRVTHKVKDFDAWKKEFDDHKQARIDAGLADRALGYSDGDKHMVSSVFVVNDLQKAKAFIKSADLKEKMAKAGVEGPPSFFFYNVVQKY
jgi:hypothetical protein